MESDYQKRQKEELEYRMNATVGTAFIVHTGGWYNRPPELKTVEHATKTQLTINGVKYNRQRGVETGGNSYCRASISMPTEDLLAKVERGEMEKTAIKLAYNIKEVVTRLGANRFSSVQDIKTAINLEREFLENIKKLTEETQNLS